MTTIPTDPKNIVAPTNLSSPPTTEAGGQLPFAAHLQSENLSRAFATLVDRPISAKDKVPNSRATHSNGDRNQQRSVDETPPESHLASDHATKEGSPPKNESLVQSNESVKRQESDRDSDRNENVEAKEEHQEEVVAGKHEPVDAEPKSADESAKEDTDELVVSVDEREVELLENEVAVVAADEPNVRTHSDIDEAGMPLGKELTVEPQGEASAVVDEREVKVVQGQANQVAKPTVESEVAIETEVVVEEAIQGEAVSLDPVSEKGAGATTPTPVQQDGRDKQLEVEVNLKSDSNSKSKSESKSGDDLPQELERVTRTEAEQDGAQEVKTSRSKESKFGIAPQIQNTAVKGSPVETIEAVNPVKLESTLGDGSQDFSRDSQGDRNLTQSSSGQNNSASPTPATGTPQNNFARHLLTQPKESQGSQIPLDSVQNRQLVNRVAKAIHSAQSGDGAIRIRLNPAELGALKLELRIENGNMVAKVEAEHASARHVLLENLPVLRERLAEQGMNIESFDVDLSNDQQGHLRDPESQLENQNSEGGDSNQADESPIRSSDEVNDSDHQISRGQVSSDGTLNVIV